MSSETPPSRPSALTLFVRYGIGGAMVFAGVLLLGDLARGVRHRGFAMGWAAGSRC